MKPLVMDNIIFIGSLCFASILLFYGSLLVVFIAVGGFIMLFNERLKNMEKRWRELDEESKRKSQRDGEKTRRY